MSFPVIVTGPTASGKSALGLRLAADFKTDIISADSVLVYRGADIGSAKPSTAEQAAVRHHLIDVADATESYNAGRFLREVARIESQLKKQGKRSLLVGGTTLYLSAYVDGLAELPQANAALRLQLNARALPDLYAELKQRDPMRAQQLHPNDRLRIERALETLCLSKSSVSSAFESQQRQRRQALVLVLLWDRDELYRRIELRAEYMVRAGLLGETKALLAQAGPSAPVLQALGYRQALEVLQAKRDETALVAAVAQFTRNFAKRQMTFWRNEPEKRGWAVQPQILTEANCVELSAGTPLTSREQRRSFKVLSLSYEELLARIQQGVPDGECEVWLLDAQRLV